MTASRCGRWLRGTQARHAIQVKNRLVNCTHALLCSVYVRPKRSHRRFVQGSTTCLKTAEDCIYPESSRALALQGLAAVYCKTYAYSSFASKNISTQCLLPPSRRIRTHTTRQYAAESVSTSSKVQDASSKVQNLLKAPAQTVQSSATTVYKQMPRPVSMQAI